MSITQRLNNAFMTGAQTIKTVTDDTVATYGHRWLNALAEEAEANPVKAVTEGANVESAIVFLSTGKQAMAEHLKERIIRWMNTELHSTGYQASDQGTSINLRHIGVAISR